MLTQRSKHWDKLCDLLDEHFPKGKCKERGRAIVLVSYIDMMLQEIKDSPMGVSQGFYCDPVKKK